MDIVAIYLDVLRCFSSAQLNQLSSSFLGICQVVLSGTRGCQLRAGDSPIKDDKDLALAVSLAREHETKKKKKKQQSLVLVKISREPELSTWGRLAVEVSQEDLRASLVVCRRAFHHIRRARITEEWLTRRHEDWLQVRPYPEHAFAHAMCGRCCECFGPARNLASKAKCK